MTLLFGKLKQALALWWSPVCVFSTSQFFSQKSRSRKGLKEKQRKRTKRFVRATMKGRAAKRLDVNEMERNSRDEENLWVIDTINLFFNWKRGKMVRRERAVLYKKFTTRVVRSYMA
jgi:hypothetical protein